MRRTVITTLILVPVGTVLGFLCCAVIAHSYDVISTNFHGVTYSDRELANSGIGLTLVGMLGGIIGAVVTPIVYLIGFTQVRTRELVMVSSVIALATVVLGLFGAFFGPNAALFMTVVGFVGACATAYAYMMGHVKEGES